MEVNLAETHTGVRNTDFCVTEMYRYVMRSPQKQNIEDVELLQAVKGLAFSSCRFTCQEFHSQYHLRRGLAQELREKWVSMLVVSPTIKIGIC